MNPEKSELGKEKCERCKKELGWRKMHVPEEIDAWLCWDCIALFYKEFEKFKTEFLKSINL